MTSRKRVGRAPAPVGGRVARNFAFTGQPMLSPVEGADLPDYRAAGAVSADALVFASR